MIFKGLTIYDTENIVSLILGDNYKCYDYESVYTVAKILKDKFKLLEEINSYEIEGKFNLFTKLILENKDSLLEKCDECLIMEDEMFISQSREDKDFLAKKINNKLSGDVFSSLINVYENNIEKVKA